MDINYTSEELVFTHEFTLRGNYIVKIITKCSLESCEPYVIINIYSEPYTGQRNCLVTFTLDEEELNKFINLLKELFEKIKQHCGALKTFIEGELKT